MGPVTAVLQSFRNLVGILWIDFMAINIMIVDKLGENEGWIPNVWQLFVPNVVRIPARWIGDVIREVCRNELGNMNA